MANKIHEKDKIFQEAYELCTHLIHQSALIEQQLFHLKTQIANQKTIMQQRINIINNQYSQYVEVHLPNIFAPIILSYANIQYCTEHNTYFPYNWKSCILCCVPPNMAFGTSEKIVVHGPGNLTQVQDKTYLQFSEVDEMVTSHVLELTASQNRRMEFIVGDGLLQNVDEPLILTLNRDVHDNVQIYIERRNEIPKTVCVIYRSPMDKFYGRILVQNMASTKKCIDKKDRKKGVYIDVFPKKSTAKKDRARFKKGSFKKKYSK